MTASLVLLLAVATAYLAAHVAFEWLARRFLIVSAAEYLVLGVLLGPQATGLLGASLVGSLAPVVTLALGWIGAAIGAEFRLLDLVATPARVFRIGFAESAVTFVVVAGLEFLALRWSFAPSDAQATVAAVALGAMAVAASNVGITLVADLLGAHGSLATQLARSAQLNAFVAVATFGLLLSIHHVAAPASRPLTPTEWVAVSMGLGVVGGALFHIFLGETPDSDRLFVSLVGGVVLVSGAAAYLHLSPLFAGFFFGTILANTTSRPDALVSALSRVERPFYFVLLLLGGATWQASARAWIAPVALFVVARIAAKVGGARLASRANAALPELGLQWGWALVGQGRLALAIGLSYLRQANLPYRNTVFTAAVASILFTEFFSARLVRRVLAGSPEGIATDGDAPPAEQGDEPSVAGASEPTVSP